MLNSNYQNCKTYTPKLNQNKVILVAGPTASGKSEFALSLAEKINGEIINADSMQVFEDVPTLTARPVNYHHIPHYLYGFLQPNDAFNVFKWVKMASLTINKVLAHKKIPIVIGGTGFYFQTLTKGISPLPETTPEIRQQVKQFVEDIGFNNLLEKYQKIDSNFKFSDPQRVLRAFEIYQQTNKTMTEWQKLPFKREIEADFYSIFINPDREVLYDRCNSRFKKMFCEKTFEEVKKLIQKNPSPESLISKAIGVAEIKDFLDGKTNKNNAIEHACQMTRNYAKRQVTWFSHRYFSDINLKNNEINDEILTNVLRFIG